ncbi:MAG: hypothetical protein ACE5JM_02625, partial [Armatimonadota bacterium]
GRKAARPCCTAARVPLAQLVGRLVSVSWVAPVARQPVHALSTAGGGNTMRYLKFLSIIGVA